MDDWLFDPFSEFSRIRRQMRRFFGEDFPRTAVREPLMDISDKGNALEVTIELPGIRKEDIDLNVTETTLAVKAKIKREEKEEKKGYYYHERAFQAYSRVIGLPTEVIPEKAKAEFNNGILTVTMPKKRPEARPEGRKIKIE